MSLPGSHFTYDDYKRLPEDQRCEITEGELLVTPSPNLRHQRILMRLSLLVGAFVEAAGLGEVLAAPTDVVLAHDTVVQPDLLFVSRDRKGSSDPQAVHGAPDLVIEILSPATAGRDRVVKRDLYGKHGVREYWIVDPDANSIEILLPEQSGLETWQVFRCGSSLTSPLLDGLRLSVDEVMRP